MRAKVVSMVFPLVIMGLFLFFGVPAYLDRAPDWYFQLPSILPPNTWSTASRLVGLILLGFALLVVIASTRKSKAKNTKELVVLIQNENQQLLEDAAWALEESCVTLKEIFGFKNLTIFRGDFQFCVEWLRVNKAKPALIILSPRMFASKAAKERLRDAGVDKIYGFQGSTVTDLVQWMEECVHHFMTGKFL